jgi:glucose-1-phosphate thymidylyltransferase
MPLANRALISFVVESVKRCGIVDICLVVNYYNRKAFEQTFGDGSAFGVHIHTVLQETPKGIAHALSLCEQWVGDDTFLLYLGDNLLEEDLNRMKSVFIENKAKATILLKQVEDPRAFGVATIEEGKIVRLVEKPKDPETNFAVLGVYFFDPVVFEVIKRLKPSWRGEYEITDAIALLIESGYPVNYYFLEGWWKDTGKVPDFLDANRRILSSGTVTRDGEIELIHSYLGDNVSVGKHCSFINCRIEGPSVIGDNVAMQNVYLGPNTSVGDDCVLEHVELSDSIIMERSRLINTPGKIVDSLIGSDFEWVSSYPGKGNVQIISGDHNKIFFL